MKVAVLGAGAWGTALARLLAEDESHSVSLWSRSSALCADINAARENARYLPGVRLQASVTCTTDVQAALVDAGMVVFVLPSHATREVARAAAPHVAPGVLLVNASKGIENDTLMFIDEVLAEELPPHARDHLATLSGPSFARELAGRLPTAVVVAAREPRVSAEVTRHFRRSYLRIYASDDVVGVECGGALKNVIAIGAGAVEGMGFGHNTRAALVTRGLAEMARLAIARGGSALTLAGLAGLGDLVLTCTGELSRNRTVGYEMGRGRSLASVLAGLGHVAEGVRTAKSAHDLAQKLGVDMPITAEVYSVLYDGKPIQHAVRDLMARELGYEFDPHATARATSK
ncbi:MAG: NAD(P)-dependent glycerol-3-phosphate dehydrogenase [Myxococcota bacterium]|nr:NAD(P)-dependent glycerol-3-phosphate dehydrogenase [Myxococcota bacterium]